MGEPPEPPNPPRVERPPWLAPYPYDGHGEGTTPMPRKPRSMPKPPADTDVPDSRVVLENRHRFLGWLAGACDSNLGAFEFDRARTLGEPRRRMAVWPEHMRLFPAYIRRLRDDEEPVRALPAVTLYLLALRTLGPSRPRATGVITYMAGLPCFAGPLRAIARRVADGKMLPDARWLGELEWRLLDACGVVWPEYVVGASGLGDVAVDALERDIGARLNRCFAEFIPPDLSGQPQNERQAIRWAAWFLNLDVGRIRRELLRGASLAALAPALLPAQAHDAALATIGLYVLLRRDHRDIGGPSLLEMVRTIDSVEVTRELVRRLDRQGEALQIDQIVEEYWSTCDLVEDARTAPITPEATAPADDHGPDFAWIRVGGEEYRFSTPRQRLAIQFLWKARGKPVAEDSVREHLGVSEGIDWRLSYVFRSSGVPHPAWGSIIVQEAPRSRMYKLVRT